MKSARGAPMPLDDEIEKLRKENELLKQNL
jgi:hypothetical protein